MARSDSSISHNTLHRASSHAPPASNRSEVDTEARPPTGYEPPMLKPLGTLPKRTGMATSVMANPPLPSNPG
ncbi:hypothetical protein [Longimonas halophila]|uniref:hypothetical protein n=1 Tax=Longimonas halophila TaxID=1469170 RepID=UPI001141B5D0|nr:hypothetical protein [Longimonas halophila]